MKDLQFQIFKILFQNFVFSENVFTLKVFFLHLHLEITLSLLFNIDFMLEIQKVHAVLLGSKNIHSTTKNDIDLI